MVRQSMKFNVPCVMMNNSCNDKEIIFSQFLKFLLCAFSNHAFFKICLSSQRNSK